MSRGVGRTLADDRLEDGAVSLGPDRTAAALFRDVVLPARERFAARTGILEPLRTSLQMATAATTGLAGLAISAGNREAAHDWAAQGYRWIRQALADPGTWVTVDESTEDACRFALRAVPALLIAAELQVTSPETDQVTDLAHADRLLASARRWVDSFAGEPDQYVRQSELDALADRLNRIRVI